MGDVPSDIQSTPKSDPRVLQATLDAVLWPLERLRMSNDQLEMVDMNLFSGGFGVVHKAKLKSNNQIVAVKSLNGSGNTEERLRLAIALARELRVWARLQHPNVLKLEGYCLDPKMTTAWFISPFLDHGNIMRYLAEVEGTTQLALKLIADAAKGLEYLHSLEPPVCHADIKPENILITHQVTAVLADFGLALLVDQHSGLTTKSTGKVRGTIRYMSPELFPFDAEGESEEPEQVVHTLNSDIWAFGCVVLEVLTGKIPYPRLRNDASVIQALAQRRLPANPEALSLPGDYVVTLLTRCWEPDPTSRPSASECLSILLTESDAVYEGPNMTESSEIVLKVESTWRNDEVFNITVSEDGMSVALVHGQLGKAIVSLLDLETGTVTHELLRSDCEHIQEAHQAFFSADGTTIALLDDAYVTHIWEPFEGRVEARKWELPIGVDNVCYCGALSIVGYIEYDQVYIWLTDLGYQLQWNNAVLTNGIPIAADYPRPNAVAQSEVPTIPNLQASTITISPDGRFLAVSLAAPPFDVQIWSIDQGCLLSRLEGHLIGARWLKFFPDGNRLRSTAWDDLEMKIWDTSTLMSLQTSPKTGFLRLDCPCTMTFSLDTAHTPEWTVWKVWRIAPDCSWAAMTRGDGKVAFYNSKTREKYSAFVTYEVDPSAERPEKMFNEIDLSFITPTSGVMVGLTDKTSTARAWKFEITQG